jgi:hypothetical protein
MRWAAERSSRMCRRKTPLFQQVNWETMAEVELHGRPHVKMRADLDFYPPCHTPEVGYVALRKAA